MRRAILYKKLKYQQAQCLACHHQCLIPNGETGLCGVRKNIGGEINLLAYGKAASIGIDPIEKKPLFHFLPGNPAFSLGTLGCNFCCDFCQNWQISQAPEEKIKNDADDWGEDWPPEKIVDYCQARHIPIIAYTYNEPTVWAEYALDTMKLARQAGIKNVWVSNGFMSPETLDLIIPYLDAVNIDLKSFSEDFYRKICRGHLEPIQENIRKIRQQGIWEEITTLIIAGLNDSPQDLKAIAEFLVDISPDLPWHISAFYPCYRMEDRPPTAQKSLVKAREIGQKTGLRYVYTGNMPDSQYESTFCPHCHAAVIERWGITEIKNNLQKGKCPQCQTIIPGVW